MGSRTNSYQARESPRLLATLKSRSEEHALRLLAQLADGSLQERDRRAVESYLASSPEAQRRFERQRHVATALRTGGPELPAGLGQGVFADSHPIPPATRLHGFVWAVAAAGVLVAAIAGISLLRAGSRSEEHTSELQSRENLVC